MRVDPYLMKRFSKWHPKRLAYTLWCRASDRFSRGTFNETVLPYRHIENVPPVPVDVVWTDTQVEPEQMRHLLWSLSAAEMAVGSVVELGSWRGVTTRCLAMATTRQVFAIDPYIGDANETNMKVCQRRLAGLGNVSLRRETAGEAARGWAEGPVAFIFIDAAHDYANVAHDITAWRPHLAQGAILALHDTDNIVFAGCRRAVFEVAHEFELLAHVPNLTVLRTLTGIGGLRP